MLNQCLGINLPLMYEACIYIYFLKLKHWSMKNNIRSRNAPRTSEEIFIWNKKNTVFKQPLCQWAVVIMGFNDLRFLLPFSTVAAAAVPSWGSEGLCNVSRCVPVKQNAGMFILSSADGPAFNVLWPLGPCQHGGASRITAQPPYHPERHPECVLVWGKKNNKTLHVGTHLPTSAFISLWSARACLLH